MIFTKYIQLNFDSSIIKIKASYASKDGVSHAEFWNSAAFGRMIEWSREILIRNPLRAGGSPQAIKIWSPSQPERDWSLRRGGARLVRHSCVVPLARACPPTFKRTASTFYFSRVES